MFNWLFLQRSNNQHNVNSQNNNIPNLLNSFSSIIEVFKNNPEQIINVINTAIVQAPTILHLLNSVTNTINATNSNSSNTDSTTTINNEVNNDNKNTKSNKRNNTELNLDNIDNNSKRQKFNVNNSKSNKEKTIIWTRVSTKSQDEKISCEQQLKECNTFIEQNQSKSIPSDVMTLKMVGSGYNTNRVVSDNLKLLYSLLDDNYKITLICYMPDRFLRNKNESKKCIDTIIKKQGTIYFVKSDTNNSLNSKDNLHKIYELLHLAEVESKIKSQKMKDSYKNNIQNKVIKNIDNLNISSLKNFITIFIYGGKLDKCINYFRDCVDWKTNKEWKQNYYNNPIEVDETLLILKNNKELFIKSCQDYEDELKRCKTIINLFKTYKISVPKEFENNNRKNWTLKFIEYFKDDPIEILTENFKQF